MVEPGILSLRLWESDRISYVDHYPMANSTHVTEYQLFASTRYKWATTVCNQPANVDIFFRLEALGRSIVKNIFLS